MLNYQIVLNWSLLYYTFEIYNSSKLIICKHNFIEVGSSKGIPSMLNGSNLNNTDDSKSNESKKQRDYKDMWTWSGKIRDFILLLPNNTSSVLEKQRYWINAYIIPYGIILSYIFNRSKCKNLSDSASQKEKYEEYVLNHHKFWRSNWRSH